MNCAEIRELLVEYNESLLDDSKQKLIESHLKECAACSAEYDELTSLHNRLAENGKALGGSDFESDVLNQIIRRQSKQLRKTTSQLQLWRIIMKSRITKFAAVAVILIAVGVSFTVMEKTTAPAWAIEQVIESMANYRGVKMFSTTLDKSGTKISSVTWATANEDFTLSDQFKLVLGNGVIRWVKGNDTYHYEPAENKVYFSRGEKETINPWIGPKMFETLWEATNNWQETFGVDPSTGRQRVYVTCSHPVGPKSWWFEFDLETNLPVRYKQWANEDMQGQPQFNVTEIVFYEDLAPETFDVQIPESAALEERLSYLNFPIIEEIQVFGTQIDQWHIKTSRQVEAHSYIDIAKVAPDHILRIRLPYSEGILESVKADDKKIWFDNVGNGKYKLYLTEDFNKNNTIECIWTMPLDKLEKVDYGFRTRLQSLLYVTSYKLNIVLDSGCGYEKTGDPVNDTFLVFSDGSDDPKMFFGSCGIAITKIE